jgi:hypothetical protein
MDLLSLAAVSVEELSQVEEFAAHDHRTIGFIGHYVPYGVPARLEVVFNSKSNDYLSYELSIQKVRGDEKNAKHVMEVVEFGEGIDIPESILKLAKMVQSPNSRRKAYKKPQWDVDVKIVFDMIYTDNNVPDSPEKTISEPFYTIIMVSWEGIEEDNPEEGSWYLPNKWWHEARIMTPNLRVYNTLDFARHPMELFAMQKSLLKAFAGTNPFLRMLQANQMTQLRAQGNAQGNKYLFIPVDPFLRQRRQTWLYAGDESI